jgi:hypothetical protein
MDDILVPAQTGGSCAPPSWVVSEILGSPRLEKHADKTFTGRIERGFDFLATPSHADRYGSRELTIHAGGTVPPLIAHSAFLLRGPRINV